MYLSSAIPKKWKHVSVCKGEFSFKTKKKSYKIISILFHQNNTMLYLFIESAQKIEEKSCNSNLFAYIFCRVLFFKCVEDFDRFIDVKKCDYENKMKLTTKTRKENRCVIDWNRWVGWFVHWRHAILFGRALNVKLGVHFLLLLLHLRFSSTNKNIFFFSGHNICFLSISLKTHAPWFLVYHPKKIVSLSL